MKQRYTIYALFLLSLFVSISASAQIKGVITDSLTNEPLMYITVQYEGKGVGGISNANGEYQVESEKIETIVSMQKYHHDCRIREEKLCAFKIYSYFCSQKQKGRDEC